MIDIRCPSDGTVYHADESQAGKNIRCRTCGATLKVEIQKLTPVAPQQTREVTVTPASNAQLVREPIGGSTAISKPFTQTEKITIGIGIALLVTLMLLFLPTKNPEEIAPSAARPAEGSKPPARPPCAEGYQPQRFATGTRISKDRHVGGKSTLHVVNGTGFDAVVKFVSVATGKAHRSFYVRTGDSYTVGGLEPGTYWVRFATGKDWVPRCRRFLEEEDISEFENPLKIGVGEELHNGEMWRYAINAEVTLNEVPEGNAKIRSIDKARFDEGDEELPTQTQAPLWIVWQACLSL